MSRTRNRLTSVALIAGLGLAAAACGSSSKTPAAASATTVPAAVTDTVTAIPSLSGVGTSVTLNAGTAAALTSLGVSVTPAGSATFDAGTSTVTFPITSGYAEIHSDKSHQPGWIEGSIQHDGSGLTLTAGTKTLTASNFVVDPGNSMLYATVGGQPKIPFLFLNGANVKVSMAGSDVVLDGTVAELTQTAATAIDTTFATQAVKAGLPLGTVHLVAAAGNANTYTDKVTAFSHLTGVSTSVALEASTAQALTSLGVSVAPNGSGTFNAATSTVSFPITGGTVVVHSDANYKPGYIAGVVLHQGSGLTFTKGSTSVALTDFVVDPGNSILTGTVGGKVGVPLLSLDGTAVKVSTQGGDVLLDGTVAKLTATAAGALNAAFSTTAFTPGLALGTVHLVASGT